MSGQDLKDGEERFVGEYFDKFYDSSQWTGWVKKVKRDKVQDRLIAIGKYRIISIKRNVRGKKSVQREGHMLTMKEIKFSDSKSQLILTWSDFFIDFNSPQALEILNVILESRSKICYGMEPIRVVTPKNSDPITERINESAAANDKFLSVYRAWCNYFEKKPSPELEMLVEDTFLSSRPRELVLTSAPGIELKTEYTFDLQPVFMALQYDKHFLSVELENVARKDVLPMVAQMLVTNRTLTRLVLRGLEMTDGYVALGDALRRNGGNQLCEINLSRNNMGDKGFKGVADGLMAVNHGVTALEVADNHATGKGVVLLIRALMTNVNVQYTLNTLDISDAKFDTACNEQLSMFLTNLKDSGNLRVLRVRNTGLSVTSLCEALRLGVFETLEEFDVGGNRIDQVKALVSFLGHSARLRVLRVDGCKLGSDVVAGLMEAISHSKKRSSALALYADGNDLGGSGGAKLGAAVPQLKHVTVLSLRNCGLGAEGLFKLMEPMGADCPLEVLDLSLNVKGGGNRKAMDSLFKMLANVVQVVTRLRVLVLQGDGKSHFLTGDMEMLMGAINSSALCELDISFNKIGDVGAKKVAEVLRKNTALRYVSLDGNGFSSAALTALKNTLSMHNSTLYGIAPFTYDLDALRSNPRIYDAAAEAWHEIQDLLTRAALSEPDWIQRCHLLSQSRRPPPPAAAPPPVEVKAKRSAKSTRRAAGAQGAGKKKASASTRQAEPQALGASRSMSNRAVPASSTTTATTSPRGAEDSRKPSRPPPKKSSASSRNKAPAPPTMAKSPRGQPPPPRPQKMAAPPPVALPAMPGRRASLAPVPKLDDEDDGPPLPPRPEDEEEEEDYDEEFDEEFDEYEYDEEEDYEEEA